MKFVDIEKLLQWAYRDELPKGTGSSGSGFFAPNGFAQLGVMVDTSYRGGLPAAMGECHPDAKRIEAAVARLPRNHAIDWSASRHALLGDWAAIAERDPLSVASYSARALVTMHAAMGTRPQWRMDDLRLVRRPQPRSSGHV